MSIEVGEDVIVFAFRYSLGRISYAHHTMIECISKNIELLETHTLKQIKREVYEHYYEDQDIEFVPNFDNIEYHDRSRWFWLCDRIAEEIERRERIKHK